MKKACFGIACWFICSALSLTTVAQTPGIKWSRTYANAPSSGEVFYDMKVTSDMGLIMVGIDTGFLPLSNPLFPEKNIGGRPWIVKTDSSGNVIWKRIFEGIDPHNSLFTSVVQSADGGFVAVGKARINFPVSDTGQVLVAKYSSNGTLVWQKQYGGSKSEIAHAVLRTSTNGYIIVGTATSGDGDVIGNHGLGNGDVWVIRINEAGNIIWSRCYGGSSHERGMAITQASDYGFIIAGSAMSVNGDLTGNNGASYSDGWLFKTDSSGNILWQKNFGGVTNDILRSVVVTNDNSIVAVGTADSTPLITNGSKPSKNAWALKTSSSGALLWSIAYGGSGEEGANHVQQTVDNNFIVTGFSSSGDGDVSGNNGLTDIWMFKVNNEGNIIWQKAIGTSKRELGFSSVFLNDNNFIVSGSLEEPNGNLYDGYAVYLGNSNIIKGILFHDANSNNVFDAGEKGFNNALVKVQGSASTNFVQPSSGLFSIDVDAGNYVTSVQFTNSYFLPVPLTRNSNFVGYFNTDSFGFAIQPIPNKQDLQVHLIPASPARPGFKAQYTLNYKNVGTTTIASGSVKLIKDSRATLSAALPVPSAIVADTLTWNYTNLKPLDSIAIGLEFQLAPPPALNINDTLKYTAVILPVAGDLTPADDTSSLRQRVQGSFDPNDKQENFAGKIPLKNVQDGSYINYVIRFQNTGNDTAFFVRLLDTLDTKLDWSSFQMIGSSHAYNLTIKDGNKLNWFFENIKLPDSTINLARSIGYVAFRIKPKNNLTTGEVIQNKASIYFDYNLPIVTNTANTIVSIETTTSVREVQNNEMKLVLGPNPANGYSLLQINGKLTGKFELRIIDNHGRILSRQIVTKNSLAETVQVPLNVQQLSSGVYYIQLQQKQKSWWQKVVVQ